MIILKHSGILLFLALTFSHQSWAQLQRCEEAKKSGIEDCNGALSSTRAATNASDASLMESSTTSRIRGGGADLSGQASGNAQRWAAVQKFCKEQRDNCAKECNSVAGTPEIKKKAETLKQDCFGQINQVLQIASQAQSSNEMAQTQAADSANPAGAAGEETIKGNVHLAGSGPQPLGFVQNGEQKVYYSSTVGGNLKANMQYLQSISDPGTTVTIQLPAR